MFIAKQNGTLIIAASVDRQEVVNKTVDCLNVTIEETDTEYVFAGDKYVTREEASKLEQDKINRLTMTALDIIKLVKSLGVTDEVIFQYLQSNPSIQMQLAYCKDVYCGVVRQLCPLKITEDIIITDEMIVQAFKQKHNLE